MISLTHDILKNDINELIYKNRKRLTDTKNKCMITKRDSWNRGKRDKLGVWD